MESESEKRRLLHLLSGWLDLGNWFSAAAQLGTEHALESGDSEFFYNVALGYSFLTQGTKKNLVRRHFPKGMVNLFVELTGRTGLSGEDDGRNSTEVLFGTSYNLNSRWEVRGGYQIPVGGNREIDDSFVLGVIQHF